MTRQRSCNTALLNKPNSSHQILNAARERLRFDAGWLVREFFELEMRVTHRGCSSSAIDFSSTGFHYSGYLMRCVLISAGSLLSKSACICPAFESQKLAKITFNLLAGEFMLRQFSIECYRRASKQPEFHRFAVFLLFVSRLVS